MTDLNRVLDLAAAALVPDGVMVVVEWAREHFDEATAGWCFARLPGPGADRGWLNDRYEQWQASGQRWDAYFRAWADGEGLHSGEDILRALQARFETRELSYGAYFFADLSRHQRGRASSPRSTPGRSGPTGSSTTAAGENREYRPVDPGRARSSRGRTWS